MSAKIVAGPGHSLGECQQWRCTKPGVRKAIERTHFGAVMVDFKTKEPVGERVYCGLHASMMERRAAKYEAELASRAAYHASEDERLRRVSYASNVAMFLGQKLGVTFEVDRHGNELSITVDAAEALLARLPWLP